MFETYPKKAPKTFAGTTEAGKSMGSPRTQDPARGSGTSYPSEHEAVTEDNTYKSKAKAATFAVGGGTTATASYPKKDNSAGLDTSMPSTLKDPHSEMPKEA